VTVICLATGAGLLVAAFPLLDHSDRDEAASDLPEDLGLDRGGIESLA
jgi:hypothetical protein